MLTALPSTRASWCPNMFARDRKQLGRKLANGGPFCSYSVSTRRSFLCLTTFLPKKSEEYCGENGWRGDQVTKSEKKVHFPSPVDVTSSSPPDPSHPPHLRPSLVYVVYWRYAAFFRSRGGEQHIPRKAYRSSVAGGVTSRK